MGLMDPHLRKASLVGIALAGSLIDGVQRRTGTGSHRTPDRLLVEDAAGMPGPALVGPLADYDRLLLPEEVDRAQVKELALAAAKLAAQGVGRRLLRLLDGLGGHGEVDDTEQVIDDETERTSTAETAERAAWERFVVALEKLSAVQAAYALDPDDLAAEHVRWAEVDLEDAVAVAGEFEVKKIRWLLT
jgi:hypothetical protein